MSKTILVTGGFGFIGSHLVDRLLARGQQVVVVDDLRSNAVAPAHYKAFAQTGQLRFFQMNVDSLFPRLIGAVVDEIYHLAAPVGPVGILEHAGDIVRQVVDSTYVVLRAARDWQAKLVDVSTSEVYGGGQQGLCAEAMPRIVQAETTVRLEYAVAKLAMETALINWTRTTDLHAVIVRPFNVAGPRQQAAGGFVVPRFVGQALWGEPLTVYGDGTQIRAFTHVADIVDGLLLAMEKGESGEVYNLGNPANVTSVNALAEVVLEVVGDVGIKYVDPKALHGPLFAEAANKYPDARKAMRTLGWQPMRGLHGIVYDVRDEMQSVLMPVTGGETSVNAPHLR